jgi:4-amino-4-deoxy-L-arabinose transferase-like glycosyltransferase
MKPDRPDHSPLPPPPLWRREKELSATRFGITPRRALWGLIAVATLLRLAWAASLGPGNDEAYYFLFTAHPDWSYFDQPPMVAVVEAAGLVVSGGAATPLALRLGFIALSAGSTALLARLTARVHGPRAGLLAAFLLNATGYYGLAAGTFALPDGPLLFFWLLTLDRLVVAVRAPGRIGPWVGVGLAWGGALLSKYHAVFLPAGFLLYLVMERQSRAVLRTPGPYLALALGGLLFAPVIAWNAAHGWASFAFQAARAIGPPALRVDSLAAALGGQALYLFPWIWVGLLKSLWRGGRRSHDDADPAERLLWCQAVVPLLAFSAVACIRPVLPHWSLVGFIPLLPGLGRAWEERRRIDPARMRRRLVLCAAAPVTLALLAVTQARWGWLQEGGRDTLGLVAAAHDPTVDLFGWDQVALQLRRRGLLDRPATFLFTSHWYDSAQIAFASGRRVPVLCYSAHDPRGFAGWSRPEQSVGRDGVLVVVGPSSTEPAAYDRWFERIEPLGSFDVVRAGGPVRTIHLYLCVRQTRPFPGGGGRNVGCRAAGTVTPRSDGVE